MIIACDPGTANTGLVWMERGRIADALTVRFGGKVGADQRALMERARAIAARVADWAAGRPHDAFVIEGFVGYPGRQGGYTYQTPYLCGYLHRALEGERIAVQTSRQVLNPRTRGNVARLKADMAAGAFPWEGAGLLTNDHLRSAACHGVYYLERSDIER